MPYQLSLITTEIRRKIVESVKQEKIHDKEKVLISDRESKNREYKNSEKNTTKEKKRYLTVDAIKDNSEKLEVDVEMDEDVLNDKSLGMFIDKKE